MLRTRASRVAVLELSGRTVKDPVAYVMGAMDREYCQEWPQSAYDSALAVLAQCRRELENTGTGYNGYTHWKAIYPERFAPCVLCGKETMNLVELQEEFLRHCCKSCEIRMLPRMTDQQIWNLV